MLYKPVGISSAAAIRPIKRLLPKKTKVGHAGTLDPFASGLLIVGVGSAATKQLSAFMTLDKVYIATGKLGESTDTGDHTGVITDTATTLITQQQLVDALASFGTAYLQTPPLYSALKHEGMPLYALARKRVLEAEILTQIAAQKSKQVSLYVLELISFEFPYFTIKAHVSHGTYIRSLISDIGLRVGSCATTYALERSAIGTFDAQTAVAPDVITARQELESRLF